MDTIYAMIKAGKSDVEIKEFSPKLYADHHVGIDRMRTNFLQNKSSTLRDVQVTVIAGPGNTNYAYDNYDADDIYKLKKGERILFDGYIGQDVLLIDDFYGWIRWNQFINLLDRYSLRLETKKGFTYALWTKVIITSNVQVDSWYEKESLKFGGRIQYL